MKKQTKKSPFPLREYHTKATFRIGRKQFNKIKYTRLKKFQKIPFSQQNFIHEPFPYQFNPS